MGIHKKKIVPVEIPKVENMYSWKTKNKLKNQYIIYGVEIKYKGYVRRGNVFQSYDSVIVFESFDGRNKIVLLDEHNWNYSVTTAKYRNQFLGCTSEECRQRIDSGKYALVNFNEY